MPTYQNSQQQNSGHVANSGHGCHGVTRLEQPIEPGLIPKNQRETLRLSVDEYRGRMLLSARLWYKPSSGGELRPGRDGWAIALDKLPKVIAALQRLEAEARASGLL